MGSAKSPGVWAWTIVALFGSLMSCAGPKITEVPDELVGVWTTTAGDYRGRSLELRNRSVLFGTGEGSPSPDTVVEVTREPDDGETAYTIVARDQAGDDFKLHLLYDAAQSELRLKNRPEVKWTKE